VSSPDACRTGCPERIISGDVIIIAQSKSSAAAIASRTIPTLV
jgi:hypothetical protein